MCKSGLRRLTSKEVLKQLIKGEHYLYFGTLLPPKWSCLKVLKLGPDCMADTFTFPQAFGISKDSQK